MPGFIGKLSACWLAATTLVAGIDAYKGNTCTGQPGQLVNEGRRTDALVSALAAIPVGAIRGVVYNFEMTQGRQKACAAASHTKRFSADLNHLFSSPAAGNIYLLNQAIVGIPGAAIGGAGADWYHAVQRVNLPNLLP